MMRPLTFPASAVVVGLMAVPCVASPRLEETTLYTTTTRGCETLDLRTWKHPTLSLLTARGVTVHKVELCNGKRYPVYTVSFRFDPHGQTDAFFHPLYAEMAARNGFWPFSFVDVADAVIVGIVPKGTKDIKVEYEDYEPSGSSK